MNTQNNLYRRQDRWEIVKALSGMFAACALMVGAIVGLAHWIRPEPMFPPGTVITIPPAKP
jgi:hypothetical protein